nr:MAG TPA: hypothetical protein [Caudoviricetes sp.]
MENIIGIIKALIELAIVIIQLATLLIAIKHSKQGK